MIELDGTPNKGRLGANAILGVSMALRARDGAGANASRSTRTSSTPRTGGDAQLPLPVPMMNILNGGAHADSSVDFQEFMVMPVGATDVRRGACAPGAEVFHTLRGILKKKRLLAPASATRAASRRACRRTARRSTSCSRRSRGAGYKAGERRRPRPRRRGERVLGRGDAGATSSRSRENRRATPTRWWRSTKTGCGTTRSSRSRTASPRATGTAGRR